MEKGNIIHEGVISSMDNDGIQVTIESKSACAGCHANSACNAADKSSRIIKVKNSPFYQHLNAGDRVTLEGAFSSGLKAVLFAYVIPFVLILALLMVMAEITENNLISGITALAILVPYYLGLHFFRNKFEKEFRFIIKQ